MVLGGYSSPRHLSDVEVVSLGGKGERTCRPVPDLPKTLSGTIGSLN